MRDSELNIPLEEDASRPVYLRICRSLARAIETGVLRPGDLLPGSRALAEHFGVNRNTVVSSLNLLESQGWVDIHPKRGTFVAPPGRRGSLETWEQHQATAASIHTPGPFRWTDAAEDPAGSGAGTGLDLRDGLPDARLFPSAELGRCYKRAMDRRQGEVLTSQDPKGHVDFRKAFATWLARRRGLLSGQERLVTTTGLRMAIELLVKATLWNAGVVAVEAPGSPELRRILESQRIPILGIPVDAEGMEVAELAEHLESGVPIRLVILGSGCQFPTGTRLSGERRRRLLDLVERYPVVVAEDEGASAWYWTEPPPLPLAHFDRTGKVVLMGSFSQWLAPGIHAGFIYARSAVANRLAALKQAGHVNTDQVLESALASLMVRDEIQTHLRLARSHYVARLRKAAEVLDRWPGFQVEPGSGGLGLWVRLPPQLDARAWQQACAMKGISLLLGSDCGEAPGPVRHAYLGLGQLDLPEQERALALLASCLDG